MLTEGIGIKSKLLESQYAFILDKNKVGPFSSFTFQEFVDSNMIVPVYLDSEFINVNYNDEIYLKSTQIFKSFELNKKGELILIDKNIKDSQKGIFGEAVKNSMSFFSGKKNLSLPAHLFQPKTNLEKVSEFFGNLTYIHKAVESEDANVRFQNVVTFIISNFYYGLGIRKPLNPYLGETLQGFFPDESFFYAERICHQPPIDSFFLINEKKQFKIHGKLESVTKLNMNNVSIIFKGLITVELGEEKIFTKLCDVNNSGIIYGTTKMTLEDNFYFCYPQQNLKCLVQIGDSKNHKFDKLSGGIYKLNEEIKNINKFEKEIFFKIHKQSLISEISGCWTSVINWDGNDVWHNKMKCYKMHMVFDALPSDWRFREDLLWIAYGNCQYADVWKKELEALYRSDREKRVNFKKTFTK